jgi:hypothetical protein
MTRKTVLSWLAAKWPRPRAQHAVMNAYRAIFGPAGRIGGDLVLQDLAEFCNVDRSSVERSQDGRVDPYQTHVNEGMRLVFLHIREMAQLRPDELPDPEEKNDD